MAALEVRLIWFENAFGLFNELAFFEVELVHQSAGAEVEGAAGLFVGSATLGAVVKAPSSCAAVNGAEEVGKEIIRGRLPILVTAAEWFLVVQRREVFNLAHHFEAGTRLAFGFGR